MNKKELEIVYNLEKIKGSVKLLTDNTGTTIKEAIINDLTLIQNFFKRKETEHEN